MADTVPVTYRLLDAHGVVCDEVNFTDPGVFEKVGEFVVLMQRDGLDYSVVQCVDGDPYDGSMYDPALTAEA